MKQKIEKALALLDDDSRRKFMNDVVDKQLSNEMKSCGGKIDRGLVQRLSNGTATLSDLSKAASHKGWVNSYPDDSYDGSGYGHARDAAEAWQLERIEHYIELSKKGKKD